VFCDDRVGPADLAREIREGGVRAPVRTSRPSARATTLGAAVRDAEHATIAAALAAHAGNLSHTARALDIGRNTLKRKLAALRLTAKTAR
jgi:DNA-binding NtrC family response regulator